MPAIARGKKSLFYVAVLVTVFFVVNYMLLTDSIWEYDAIVKFKQYNFLELLEIAKSKSDKALNMADLCYGVLNKKTGKTKQEAHNLGKDFNELLEFVQQCFKEIWKTLQTIRKSNLVRRFLKLLQMILHNMQIKGLNPGVNQVSNLSLWLLVDPVVFTKGWPLEILGAVQILP